MKQNKVQGTNAKTSGANLGCNRKIRGKYYKIYNTEIYKGLMYIGSFRIS